MKNSARAHIIGTDLIGLTETPVKSQPSAVEDEGLPVSHISSEEFHGWDLIVP